MVVSKSEVLREYSNLSWFLDYQIFPMHYKKLCHLRWPKVARNAKNGRNGAYGITNFNIISNNPRGKVRMY
jgi:hypothetical protein